MNNNYFNGANQQPTQPGVQWQDQGQGHFGAPQQTQQPYVAPQQTQQAYGAPQQVNYGSQSNAGSERKWSKLYWDKTKNQETFKLRFLLDDVGNFLQTSTHLVPYQKKNGTGQAYVTMECSKKDSYGTQRDAIPCELCNTSRFPSATRQWAWVIDESDGKLKIFETTWKVRQDLEGIQMQAYNGAPIRNFIVLVSKNISVSGNSKRTSYSVMPDMQSAQQGIQDFNIMGYLAGIGLQNLPDIIGTKDFPPIYATTPEDVRNASQGIMPWQKEKSGTYSPQNVGQGAPNMAPNYNPTGVPQQPANGVQYQGIYTPNPGQGTYTQNTGQGVYQPMQPQPQAPVYQPNEQPNMGMQQMGQATNTTPTQPAPNVGTNGAYTPNTGNADQGNQPNLQTIDEQLDNAIGSAVQSDPLPNFSVYDKHVPNVPYSPNGIQETDNLEEDVPATKPNPGVFF